MRFNEKNSYRPIIYKQIIDLCAENGLYSSWITVNDNKTPDSPLLNVHFISNKFIEKIPVELTDKPPLYFIHGTYSTSTRYIDILKRFANEYTCISIDLPGYGLSDNPSWYNSDCNVITEEFGRIINECVFSITGKHKVVLIGHSIGAFYCISAVEQRPEQYRQSIHLTMPGIFPTLGKYGYYWALFFKSKVPFLWFSNPFLRHMFYPIFSLIDHPRATRICNSYAHDINFLSAFIRLVDNVSIWLKPLIKTIIEIRTPLAFVFAENDTIVPEHQSKILAQLHPYSNVYVVKGHDHHFIHNTDVFERIIRNELTREKLIYEPYMTCKDTLQKLENIGTEENLKKYSASLSFAYSISCYKECYKYLLELCNARERPITYYTIDENIEVWNAESER